MSILSFEQVAERDFKRILAQSYQNGHADGVRQTREGNCYVFPVALKQRDDLIMELTRDLCSAKENAMQHWALVEQLRADKATANSAALDAAFKDGVKRGREQFIKALEVMTDNP